MEKLTKEKALKSINNSIVGDNKLDIQQLLQQTVDQTALVTSHYHTDYMTAYIRQRDDYKDNKRRFEEIIGVMRRLDKKYEDKINGKDNSKVDSNSNK